MSAKKRKNKDGEEVDDIGFTDKAAAQVHKKRALAKRTSDESSEDWASSLRPGAAMSVVDSNKKKKRHKDSSDDESAQNSGEDDERAKKGRPMRKSSRRVVASTTTRSSSAGTMRVAAVRAGRAAQPTSEHPSTKPSPSKFVKVSSAKVFPSEQQRMINNCEVLIVEARAMVASMSNAEGLNISPERLKGMFAKLEQKSTPDFAEKLTTATTVLYKPPTRSGHQVEFPSCGTLKRGQAVPPRMSLSFVPNYGHTSPLPTRTNAPHTPFDPPSPPSQK